MRRSTATRCSRITITIDTRKRRRLIDTKKKRSYYLSITKYWALSTPTITITTRCCHAHMSLVTWERCTCSGLSSTVLVLIHSMITCTDHTFVLKLTFVFTTTLMSASKVERTASKRSSQTYTI